MPGGVALGVVFGDLPLFNSSSFSDEGTLERISSSSCFSLELSSNEDMTPCRKDTWGQKCELHVDIC